MSSEAPKPSMDYDQVPEDLETDEQARQFANATLALSLKPEAIEGWWIRPNWELGNITPADMWAFDRNAVIDLAESYREQGAS
jgi:hypothetical protein